MLGAPDMAGMAVDAVGMDIGALLGQVASGGGGGGCIIGASGLCTLKNGINHLKRR
jgi:hypothetical protein